MILSTDDSGPFISPSDPIPTAFGEPKCTAQWRGDDFMPDMVLSRSPLLGKHLDLAIL